MSNWVRNLVMLWTLAVVGAVAWSDVKAGNRPDPMVLVIPAGVFTALYVRRKPPGQVSEEEAEE